MTVIDANILLYTWNADSPQHDKVRTWLGGLLSGGDAVGIPWLAAWAYLRVATNRRLHPRPASPDEAHAFVDALLAYDHVRIVEPGPRHLLILQKLQTKDQAIGALVTDAALAAIAIEHGATLASTDRDFSRFPDLRWIDPSNLKV